MDFRTERHDTPEGFSEVGIVIHEGREFASGGAAVSDAHLTCYPAGETIGADVRSWSGEVLGQIIAVSSRPAIFFGVSSWRGSRYYYMRVRLTDGRCYAVRGFGKGMIAHGKRIKG